MLSIEDLEKEIEKIKERNLRVEKDKAWETSLTRKISIAFLTYMVISVFLLFLGLPKPFINSLVPVLGFWISTLTISFLKKIWLRYF